MKILRRLSLYVLIALFLLACSQIVYGGVAPDFTLTDIDGKKFSLSDFRGKVVILDFFATYCSPCIDEMAHLKTVKSEFGGKLVIISISIWGGSIEALQQFKEEYGITWRVAKDTANVNEQYDVSTIPTLCIIDQSGYIRYTHAGGVTSAAVLSGEISALLTVSLTVTTSPKLDDVHFQVDGVDYYTSGGSFSVELKVGQHRVELVDTVITEGSESEYRFSHWGGIGSGSTNPKQVDITTSSTLEAVFNKYYRIVFAQSGSAGTPHVTVDGASYELPKALWFDSGSSHSFSYETPVGDETGTRYVLTSTSHTSPITVTSPTTVTGDYKAQYYVTVTSLHGAPTSSQWVDTGGSLTAGVTSPADDDGAGTRYRCVGYKIDDGSLQSGVWYTFTNIQEPHQIEFQWTPQYRVVVSSTHGSSDPSGVNWYDAGTSITATVTSPADDDGAGTRYTCTGWTGAGSAPATGISTSITFSITSPSSITWNWIRQYQMVFTESGPEAGRPITITVDGTPQSGTTSFSYSEWYDQDSSLMFTITELIDSATVGKRYALTNWKNSAGVIIASPQVVSKPETFTAYYQTQHYLTVNTDPRSLISQPRISPFGSDSWYNIGTFVTCTVQPINGYNFDCWTLDGVAQDVGNMELTIRMDMSHTVTARYMASTDLNSDGNVDEADLSLIVSVFQSRMGDADYDLRMDIDGNGVIDIIDVAEIATDF